MKVTLIDSNKRGVETIISALSVCRDKQCSYETIEKALDAKPVPHLSALEFAWVCFKIEGASIKTRLQLARHRLFSSMERSTRSIDLTDAEVIMPETVKNPEEFRVELEEEMFAYTRAVVTEETLEDAAYLLPLGVETTFYLAGNLRTFYEYFQKRLCAKHVQAEHYELALKMYFALCCEFPFMAKAHPCKTCKACKQ